MAKTLKLRRGNVADLPALAEGEPGFTLDGKKLYIGHPDGNVQVSSDENYTTAEKEKLEGIAAGANKYTHPTTAGNKHIPSGGADGQVLKYGGSSGTAKWEDEKTITVDDAMSNSSTNPVQNKVIHSALAQKAAYDHKHSTDDLTSGTLSTDRLPTIPVTKGGTGVTQLSSGQAVIGGGNGAVTTRAITNNLYSTSAITGSQNLVNMNTLRYALNRTTGPETADANYSTPMMRAIKCGVNDLEAGTSELPSGMIYLVYEQ